MLLNLKLIETIIILIYTYTILMIITINKGSLSKPEIFSFNNNQRKVIIGRNPKISEGDEDIGCVVF